MFSVFDLFKVSIGPSSSHTMGPMIAAKHFRDLLIDEKYDNQIDSIQVKLLGSLAFTGMAHGSDKGIILGFQGYSPETIQSNEIKKHVANVYKKNKIQIFHSKEISFTPSRDIILDTKNIPKGHSNTMEISAFLKRKAVISRTYHSIGGGFIRVKGERKRFAKPIKSPYEFESYNQLMDLCKKNKFDVHELVFLNEIKSSSKTAIRKKLLFIWGVMNECIENGLKNKGILEGGLNVKRRASKIYKQLMKSRKKDPLKAMDFI